MWRDYFHFAIWLFHLLVCSSVNKFLGWKSNEYPEISCGVPYVFFFFQQHLFPDSDRDLDELETEQQQLMFNKMEGGEDAKQSQGPQVLELIISHCLITVKVNKNKTQVMRDDIHSVTNQL